MGLKSLAGKLASFTTKWPHLPMPAVRVAQCGEMGKCNGGTLVSSFSLSLWHRKLVKG